MARRRGNRRRGFKRQKLLAETSRNNDRISTRDVEQHQDVGIPMDVLESILSRLSLKDNIRASSVCKRWLATAISVRKAEKPPWLMQFPKSNNLYEFYDPLKRKSYYLELPQLKDAELHYAKGAWLLFINPKTEHICLFNPYTQELKEFSKLGVDVTSSLAFSAPPTSPNCIVFSVRGVGNWPYGHVLINTCRPGETKWTEVTFVNSSSFICADVNKVVFSNGCFYCMSYNGSLGIYNHEEQTWSVLPYILPVTRNVHEGWGDWRLLAECNGNIFVIHPQQDITTIHKLNMHNTFVKIEDLGGASLFANLISPCIRTELLGKFRDKIYIPKIEYFGHCCHTYSFKEKRYFPRRNGFQPDEPVFFENVWIDAPEDLSIFL